MAQEPSRIDPEFCANSRYRHHNPTGGYNCILHSHQRAPTAVIGHVENRELPFGS
jgi:hypothetical protein